MKISKYQQGAIITPDTWIFFRPRKNNPETKKWEILNLRKTANETLTYKKLKTLLRYSDKNGYKGIIWVMHKLMMEHHWKCYVIIQEENLVLENTIARKRTFRLFCIKETLTSPILVPSQEQYYTEIDDERYETLDDCLHSSINYDMNLCLDCKRFLGHIDLGIIINNNSSFDIPFL